MNHPQEEPFEGQRVVSILSQGRFDLDELRQAMERLAAKEYRQSSGQSAWLFEVDNFISEIFYRVPDLPVKAADKVRQILKETARVEWRRLDAMDAQIVQKQFEAKDGVFKLLGDFPARFGKALRSVPEGVREPLGHLISKDLKLSGRRGSQVLTGLEEILRQERSAQPNIQLSIAKHRSVLGVIQKTLDGYKVSKDAQDAFWKALLSAA